MAHPDFKASVREFNAVIAEVEKATTPDQISLLERKGIGAFRTMKTAVSYAGYDLRIAVENARKRLRDNLGKPVEKPVEKSTTPKKKNTRKKKNA